MLPPVLLCFEVGVPFCDSGGRALQWLKSFEDDLEYCGGIITSRNTST